MQLFFFLKFFEQGSCGWKQHKSYSNPAHLGKNKEIYKNLGHQNIMTMFYKQ